MIVYVFVKKQRNINVSNLHNMTSCQSQCKLPFHSCVVGCKERVSPSYGDSRWTPQHPATALLPQEKKPSIYKANKPRLGPEKF